MILNALLCPKCKAFFERFRCNSPMECDCPRCQGYCRCQRDPEDSLPEPILPSSY